MLQRNKPIAIDLFCGCGGVTEGLKQSGFEVLAAVDNDPISCSTYRMNHPEVRLFENDICTLDPQVIKEMCSGSGRTVDLLIVCAPCQPFSGLNKNPDNDPRATLILQAIRFARILNPKFIFFENVPGLSRHTQIINKLKIELTTLGYFFNNPTQINAADYNVPQRRIRYIMIASHQENISIPPIVTPEGNRFTVRQAISFLPPVNNSNDRNYDSLHRMRHHSPLTIKRLANIPPNGGSRHDLPYDLWLDCHKKLSQENTNRFSDVFGRMHWDDVAPTLTTGCTDVTKGRFTHPDQNRAITAREAALLQTFPLNYKFCGTSNDIAKQIGNAVPVNLVKYLAPIFL